MYKMSRNQLASSNREHAATPNMHLQADIPLSKLKLLQLIIFLYSLPFIKYLENIADSVLQLKGKFAIVVASDIA